MGPGHVSHGDAQRRKQGDWKDLLEEIPSYLSLGKKQVARLWLVRERKSSAEASPYAKAGRHGGALGFRESGSE